MLISVESLIGKHKGTIGFVVGSGPSLRHLTDEDRDLMRENTVIAVNSSVSKIQDADYFLSDDIGVKHWNYYQEILPKLDMTYLLYHGKLKDDWQHLPKERICWFGHKTWYEPSKKKYHEDGLVLTNEVDDDGALWVIGARTAMGSAVHWAHILGCGPIVLLGCDCCYDGPRKRYFWQFDGEEPCYRLTGEPVFCTPNRGKFKDKFVDSHSMDFIEYWEALAKQARSQDIRIINASGGVLDCFPRMSVGDM